MLMSLAGLSRLAMLHHSAQSWCDSVMDCKPCPAESTGIWMQRKLRIVSSCAARSCCTIRVLGLLELARARAVAARNLSQGAARCGGAKFYGSDVQARNGLITVLDQEPLTLPHSHQHPGPAQFLAIECEFQVSFSQCSVDIRNFGLPRAMIPDHHRSTTVLSFGNHAFKTIVLDGVIFGLHGKTFRCGIEGRAFGNCPREHDAVMFKPKIVMQGGRAMFLNDELKRFFSRARAFSGGFRRHIEAAFAIVFIETADGARISAFRTGSFFCWFHFLKAAVGLLVESPTLAKKP